MLVNKTDEKQKHRIQTTHTKILSDLAVKNLVILVMSCFFLNKDQSDN